LAKSAAQIQSTYHGKEMDYIRQAFSTISTQAESALNLPGAPAQLLNLAFKALREDLGNVECASYEQARKINEALDKYEKAITGAQPGPEEKR